MKLPCTALIGPTHTQPFRQGRWLFVHNGTLFIPREVKSELGALGAQIKGNNDSEVLFYWILRHLQHAKDAEAAIAGVRASLQGLHRIWRRCRRHYPIHAHPFHGLNWVLTDGDVFFAFCYADPRGFGKAKALTSRRQPYYQLRYRPLPGGVILASEPLEPEGEWSALKNGQLLTGWRDKQRIQIRILRAA